MPELTEDIIGINSNNNDLKTMIMDMKNEAGSDEFLAKYNLGLLLNELIKHEVDNQDFSKNPRDHYIEMANKIKKTLENVTSEPNGYFNQEHINQMNEMGLTPTWHEYMERLNTAYIFIDLNRNSNQGPYKFTVLTPPPHGESYPAYLDLNAHDLSDFLTGIKSHIINVANNHYNINYQPGGRKYKKRKSLKKKRKRSLKYKRSINCKKPKGFSQKQYCKRKNKRTTKKRKSK